jgi:hypothetical protein
MLLSPLAHLYRLAIVVDAFSTSPTVLMQHTGAVKHAVQPPFLEIFIYPLVRVTGNCIPKPVQLKSSAVA